jgi:hypothetical protein
MKRKILLFALILIIVLLLTGCVQSALPFGITYDEDEDYAYFTGIDKTLTLDEANEFLSASGWETTLMEIMTLPGKMELNGEYVADDLTGEFKQFPGYEWKISIDYDSDDEYEDTRLRAHKHEATADEIENAVKIVTDYIHGLTDWHNISGWEDSGNISDVLKPGSEIEFKYFTENPDSRIELRFTNQYNSDYKGLFDPYESTFMISIKCEEQ